MDTLQQNKADIERLASIYMIANTPYFLYQKYRSDVFVQELSKKSVQEIIAKIQEIGSNGISSMEELAFVYALYISLTYKEYVEVCKYYNGEGAFSFEWFPDLRSIYLSSYTPSTTISLSIDDPNSQPEINVWGNNGPANGKKKNIVFETLEIHN